MAKADRTAAWRSDCRCHRLSLCALRLDDHLFCSHCPALELDHYVPRVSSRKLAFDTGDRALQTANAKWR
ncbi:unnamed protein product [Zymoseptoria tritici ST99CH_3D7]|uniref:Uncharacterized protein n=1 Tax=Zymoseptoria tritici (strain ST99CH_3D7) TaxID=1276538 RepID=A0A1X7RR90_ZYMT9|nr:unnamed protein product [Zymoseptoria tritici ST99CH_3D7]